MFKKPFTSRIVKFLFALQLLTYSSCKDRLFINADDTTIANAAEHPEQWLTHGLNYSEDRFSLLTEINKQNVASLQLEWVTGLGSKRGLEATPIIADGLMYATGVWSNVYALDAALPNLPNDL